MVDGSTSPTVTITSYGEKLLNIMWTYPTAPATDYAQVPSEVIDKSGLVPSGKISDLVTIDTSNNHLQIKSKESGEVIYEINGLTLEKYFNQVNSTIYLKNSPAQGNTNKRRLFGLGERASEDFFLEDGVYSMWARDQPTPVENGKAPGNNAYGTHPFYMGQSYPEWVGVFHNLANA
jgi:hypothetical protein